MLSQGKPSYGRKEDNHVKRRISTKEGKVSFFSSFFFFSAASWCHHSAVYQLSCAARAHKLSAGSSALGLVYVSRHKDATSPGRAQPLTFLDPQTTAKKKSKVKWLVRSNRCSKEHGDDDELHTFASKRPKKKKKKKKKKRKRCKRGYFVF